MEDKAVNLNHQALLDNNMMDLHQPQTTGQNIFSFDSSFEGYQAYEGPIPITYSAKVVQTRTVQLAGGSFNGS